MSLQNLHPVNKHRCCCFTIKIHVHFIEQVSLKYDILMEYMQTYGVRRGQKHVILQ